MSPSDLINREYLAQLASDLDPDDIKLILGGFRADLGRLVPALQAAGTSGSLDDWKRAAHGIAGAAGAVGAEALERAARAAMKRKDMGSGVAGEAAEISRLGEASLVALGA